MTGLGICPEDSPDCSELYPTIFIIILIVIALIICCPWCIFACSNKTARDNIKETVGDFRSRSANAFQRSKAKVRTFYVKKPITTMPRHESNCVITIDDDVFS